MSASRRSRIARRSARPCARKASSCAQSGGKGQYGHVVLDITPQERGKGYEFENKTVGGSIPKEYVPAVDKGIREAMTSGPMAGYPVVDIKITLVDGSYHEVDSNEMAFKIAGSMGFKEGFNKANPVLLEPIMKVEVVTPEDYMGDVMGDLSRRRGVLQGSDDSPSGKLINAQVPLGEMFGYATTLALDVAGSRDVHDGIRSLRRGAEQHRRSSHQEELTIRIRFVRNQTIVRR